MNKINKIKAFFAGLGALMIAYIIISLAIFIYTLFIVAFTGVSPNGGFDMLLIIFDLPWLVCVPCTLIIFYSIGYFYFLSKSKKRINQLINFIDGLYE